MSELTDYIRVVAAPLERNLRETIDRKSREIATLRIRLEELERGEETWKREVRRLQRIEAAFNASVLPSVAEPPQDPAPDSNAGNMADERHEASNAGAGVSSGDARGVVAEAIQPTRRMLCGRPYFERYYLAVEGCPEVEVTQAHFCQAERSAGFHPKSGHGPATGGFGNGSIKGRVETFGLSDPASATADPVPTQPCRGRRTT